MMAACLEVVLRHDGRCWHAVGPDFVLRADSAVQVERSLLARLASAGIPHAVDIHLRCDRELFPSWMRQYASHYFNRIVRYRPGPLP